MRRVQLADAKTQLSKLVARAAAGDQVCITRRGKPMAKLTAMDSPRLRYLTTFSCGRRAPPSSAVVGRVGGSGPRSCSENTIPSPVSRA